MATLLTLNIQGGLGTQLRPLTAWLQAQDADVLCLQECGAAVVPWLQTALGGSWQAAYAPATFNGNAILSRYPLSAVQRISLRTPDCGERRSAVLAEVALPGGPLRLCCTHLDHISEIHRFAQWEALCAETDGLAGRVLCADLNALWRADYTEAEWSIIKMQRRDGRWEPPKSRLMAAIFEAGFTDAADFPLPTSRFDTRIDYILAAPGCPWRFADTETLPAMEAGITDHNGVRTTLVR